MSTRPSQLGFEHQILRVSSQPESRGRTWVRGRIYGLIFEAVIDPEDSEYGIDHGRLRKLTIHNRYRQLCYLFDRGLVQNCDDEWILSTVYLLQDALPAIVFDE